ncbi:tetratricopeptide repeat protein [Terasakiispira papahanaumokuakeensis]|nr:tetratricopeptide repeat protein [Terasakiispira papahanaumokuakeensis]
MPKARRIIRTRRQSIGVFLMLFALSALTLTACSHQRPSPEKNQAIDTYQQLGYTYLRSNQLGRAQKYFHQALALNAHDPKALHGLALIFARQNERRLAEHYFIETLQSDTDSTIARNNYAAFLFKQSRYDEARSQLQVAVQDIRYPHRDRILLNLGRCELKLGQTQAALDHFQRALDLNPMAYDVHLELATWYLKTQQLTKAQHHWQLFDAGRTQLNERAQKIGLQIAKARGDQVMEAELKSRQHNDPISSTNHLSDKDSQYHD